MHTIPAIVFMIFVSKGSTSDLLDKLDYTIGNQFEHVLSRTDFSDPNNCQTKIDPAVFPVAIKS